MPTTYRTRSPLPALGMSSLVLGMIALLLAFLPVLGIPLSAGGLVLGVVGIFAALTAPSTYLRWALMGTATCCLALGVNVAITLAPPGYLRDQNPPPSWRPAPDRPIAPPPARP
jgi:hypothetical protein